MGVVGVVHKSSILIRFSVITIQLGYLHLYIYGNLHASLPTNHHVPLRSRARAHWLSWLQWRWRCGAGAEVEDEVVRLIYFHMNCRNIINKSTSR